MYKDIKNAFELLLMEKFLMTSSLVSIVQKIARHLEMIYGQRSNRERKKGEKKMPFSILFHKNKRQEEKLKEMKEYFQLEKMMKNHQSSIQGYYFRHFQFIR